MPEPSILYLMYHELGLHGRSTCQSEAGYTRYIVGAQSFRDQIQEIRNAGARGISVGDALAFPPGPNIAITFDDGAETDLLYAAPILREFGFHATFFVTVGFLGKPGYMVEAQLRELHDLGFEIGCHSFTHPYLPDLDQAALRHEIVDSKHELERITSHPIRHFSCPGGRYDARVVHIAREAGYQSLSTSRTHANSRATSSFELGRVSVMQNMNLPAFAGLIRGKGLWSLTLQAYVRDGAKQLLGNSLYDRMRAAFVGDQGRSAKS